MRPITKVDGQRRVVRLQTIGTFLRYLSPMFIKPKGTDIRRRYAGGTDCRDTAQL